MNTRKANQFFVSRGETWRDLDDLKKAHRRLAFKLHPDRRPDAERKQATSEMAQLNAAYKALVEAGGKVLADRAKKAGRTFDFEAWYEDAISATQRNIDDAVAAAAGWTPPAGVQGVSSAELAEWAAEATRRGFWKLEQRHYSPRRPLSMMGDKGYSERVTKSRTDRKRSSQQLVDQVLEIITATAPSWARPASGDSRQLGLFTGQPTAVVPARRPHDLIVKLTLEPDYAAIRWVAGQDWSGHMFGYQTRWHSLTVVPPPQKKKRVPKAARMSRGQVEGMLRQAGMTLLNPRAWKASRWSFPGGREIVTKAKVMRAGPGYGSGVHYYGQITAQDVAGFIEWARPKGSANCGCGARGRGRANCGCSYVSQLGAEYAGQANQSSVFSQPADIPIRKAKAVATILNSGGSGTHETWALMDSWVAADGLREVLRQIGRIYESNGSTWSTGEQRWWISQLQS